MLNLLACGPSLPRATVGEAVIWSALLLAPVAVFLLLPKLLPLGAQLRWTARRALLLAGRVVLRLEGDAAGGRRIARRFETAWRREVRAHVVGEAPSLAPAAARWRALRRARTVGRIAAVVPLTVGALVAWVCGHGSFGVPGQALRVVEGLLTATTATLAAAWIATLAGEAAALRALASAIGRTRGGRLRRGAWCGLLYGVTGGATGGFVAYLVAAAEAAAFVPDISSTVVMLGVSLGALTGAAVGALTGVVLIALTALLATSTSDA